MGLDQVRDLTRRTIERILRGRPFQTLEDFLARVDPRPQEAANLARVGALEGFGTIPAILRRLEGGGSRKRSGTTWQAGQPSLFEYPSSGHELSESGGEDWTLEQKMAAQEELLGISLEAHPLELVAEKVAGCRGDHHRRGGRAGRAARDGGRPAPERAPQPDCQRRVDDVPDPGGSVWDAGCGAVPGCLPPGAGMSSTLPRRCW